MKKTRPVTEGGRVVTRRQLEHSLSQLAQTFIEGLRQLEEHFDARVKALEQPKRSWWRFWTRFNREDT